MVNKGEKISGKEVPVTPSITHEVRLFSTEKAPISHRGLFPLEIHEQPYTHTAIWLEALYSLDQVPLPNFLHPLSLLLQELGGVDPVAAGGLP